MKLHLNVAIMYQNRAFCDSVVLSLQLRAKARCMQWRRKEWGWAPSPQLYYFRLEFKDKPAETGLWVSTECSHFYWFGHLRLKNKEGEPLFLLLPKNTCWSLLFHLRDVLQDVTRGFMASASRQCSSLLCFSLHRYSTLLTFKWSKVIGWWEHFQSGALFRLPYNPSLFLCLSDPISISLKHQSHRHLPG